MSNTFDCILFFDFYEVTFRHKLLETRNNRTLLGSIIGIIYCLTVLLLAIFYTKFFFEKKENINVVQHENSIDIPVNNLSFSPIMITLRDAKNEPIPSDFLYDFLAVYRTFYSEDQPDAKRRFNSTSKILKLENCSILKDDPKYKNFLALSSIYSKCIIPNNSTDLILYGRIQNLSSNFSTLNIAVRKCEGKKCSNNSLVSEIMNESHLSVIYYSFDIDLYEPIPSRIKIEKIMFPISLNIKKKYFNYLTQIGFYSDDGLFIQNQLNYNFYKSNSLTFDIFESTEPIYAMVIICNNNNILLYYRSYQKIPQLIGSITGLSQLIFFFSKYIVLFLSYDDNVQKICNKLFIYNIDEKEKAKEFMNYSFSQNISAVNINNFSNFSKKIPQCTNQILKIELKDLICYKIFCKKTKTLEIYKNSEKFIKEKLCFENLLQLFIKFQKFIENDISNKPDNLNNCKEEYSKLHFYMKEDYQINRLAQPQFEVAGIDNNIKEKYELNKIAPSLFRES